jgi:FcoT-like thioesterase domain
MHDSNNILPSADLQPTDTSLMSWQQMSLPESTLIDLLLEGYADGCQYLRRAEVTPPKGRGWFKADYTLTTREATDVGHFSAFEHVVMFNQLAFVTFAKLFQLGHMTGMPPLQITQFKQLQQLGMYILGIENVRYLKAFPAGVEFPGELTLLHHSYKPDKKLCIAHVHSDFGDGKAVGDFTVALKRWDLCKDHNQSGKPTAQA